MSNKIVNRCKSAFDSFSYELQDSSAVTFIFYVTKTEDTFKKMIQKKFSFGHLKSTIPVCLALFFPHCILGIPNGPAIWSGDFRLTYNA